MLRQSSLSRTITALGVVAATTMTFSLESSSLNAQERPISVQLNPFQTEIERSAAARTASGALTAKDRQALVEDIVGEVIRRMSNTNASSPSAAAPPSNAQMWQEPFDRASDFAAMTVVAVYADRAIMRYEASTYFVNNGEFFTHLGYRYQVKIDNRTIHVDTPDGRRVFSSRVGSGATQSRNTQAR